MKKKIVTENAPGAIGPYSQGIELQNLVYTSGQLGIDPTNGEMPEDVKLQTKLALENVKAVLKAGGADMCDIIKALIFITDMNDFGAVNEVYAQYMTGEILPARSCVQVARLPKDGKVEIEVIALKK